MSHMMPSGSHVMPPEHMLPPPEHSPMMHINPVNPEVVQKIVQQLKINGIFDEMRKECLADIDTKPAFLNLKQRVESHVKGILANQYWNPTLNKNQLRSRIRESVMQSGILNEGVDRILFQVFSAKSQAVFLPKIRDFVKDKGQDIIKEMMPPPPVGLPPPLAVNPPQFGAPLPGVGPVESVNQFHPPIPVQPPLPDSPIKANEEENFFESVEPSHMEEIAGQEPQPSEEILTYGDQEFYVKDEARDDVLSIHEDVVRAIDMPSPNRSSPANPKIPEDVVNPLRNLIQSLLVSKQTLDSAEPEGGVEVEGEVRVEDFSPVIDSSQIESFTDNEEEDESNSVTQEVTEAYSPKPMSPSKQPHSEKSSPESHSSSPPSAYSPYSSKQSYTDNHSGEERTPEPVQSYVEEGTTLPYDPSKFSFEHMSDSASVIEGSSSAPSPMELVEAYVEKSTVFSATDLDCEYRQDDESTDTRETREISEETKGSSDEPMNLSAQSSSESGSLSDENEQETTILVAESVEETVEEIEVMEELTSVSEHEESDRSESDDSEEKKEKKIPKAYQEKKKKKKAKKKKQKKVKAHKRARTSSISSGEITSSDSDSSVPTRPSRPPSRDSQGLVDEQEERRRLLRTDSIPDQPYWRNTGSSSDYISRYEHRRPWRYDRWERCERWRERSNWRRGGRDGERYDRRRMRFEAGREMGYAPPPGPMFRERPMYRGNYRSRTRFSPPPYRRSPPHRYSPGPRMDYPRMPFGSPRSPPRRPHSPPHLYHGEPRPFPPPRHRWPSPPRPGAGHRMINRSPPPGGRR